MSEIKTNFEFPRGDDDNKYLQRIAQDLSKNFNSVVKQLNELRQLGNSYISVSNLNGIQFSDSFSYPAGVGFSSYTFNHNFNAIPSGFLILDATANNFGLDASFSIIRLSWTTTQITVRISINTGVAAASSGTFKILVLR